MDDFTFKKKAIIPGNMDTKVIGPSALWASLNVLARDAMLIQMPLIMNAYAMIIKPARSNWSIFKDISTPSYIENVFPAYISEKYANIKEIIPVIIDDTATLIYFPIIMLFELIGKVKRVSNVPLSFSPVHDWYFFWSGKYFQIKYWLIKQEG